MNTRTSPPNKIARPADPELTTNAVAQREQPRLTFSDARDKFVSNVERGVAQALGKSMESGQFIRSLATVINENPDLLRANQVSLAVAVLHAARLGLDLTPALQLAFLAPFNVSKKIDGQWVKLPMVKMMIGYKGFVLLARRSGLCDKVDARAVYQNDLFEWDEGTEPRIVHRPKMGGDRGDVTAAYCRAKIKTGGIEFRVVDLPEIEKARRASRGAFEYDAKTHGPDFSRPKKDSPWTTHFAEMAEKTAIRRFFKGFDLTDYRSIAAAIEIDDAYDLGRRIPAPVTSMGEPAKPPEQLSEGADWPDDVMGSDDGWPDETIVDASAEDTSVE